jgi:hypothetical protein
MDAKIYAGKCDRTFLFFVLFLIIGNCFYLYLIVILGGFIIIQTRIILNYFSYLLLNYKLKYYYCFYIKHLKTHPYVEKVINEIISLMSHLLLEFYMFHYQLFP